MQHIAFLSLFWGPIHHFNAYLFYYWLFNSKYEDSQDLTCAMPILIIFRHFFVYKITSFLYGLFYRSEYSSTNASLSICPSTVIPPKLNILYAGHLPFPEHSEDLPGILIMRGRDAISGYGNIVWVGALPVHWFSKRKLTTDWLTHVSRHLIGQRCSDHPCQTAYFIV